MSEASSEPLAPFVQLSEPPSQGEDWEVELNLDDGVVLRLRPQALGDAPMIDGAVKAQTAGVTVLKEAFGG